MRKHTPVQGLPRRSFLSLLIAIVVMVGLGQSLFPHPAEVAMAASAILDHTTASLRGLAPGSLSASQHIKALPQGCKNDGKTDYPGAIDCIVTPDVYDCTRVNGNAPCTYESAQRPGDYDVDFLVIHNLELSAQAGINAFHNVNSQVSIHYIVDTDGTIYQILHETDIAYHAGNYWYNQRAIGIEHAGYAATGYNWFNSRQYAASARLVAYLITKYNIPFDRAHILGHGDIPAPSLPLSPNHFDPGPYWLWDYYSSLIQRQGVQPNNFGSTQGVFSLHPASSWRPAGLNGWEDRSNYNYFALYNGPSTRSGLIPHATGRLDDTYNIEPGMSYFAVAQRLDAAGTGMMMYQIWYGTENHLHDQPSSRSASARLVWLAAPARAVWPGTGNLLTFRNDIPGGIKIYGKPEENPIYQIGDAPNNAVFVSAFNTNDGDSDGTWYEINFNHRQAWVPASEVNA